MVNEQVFREVEAFIYKEARFADESAYDDWEALWEDDALYWVPTRPDADPEVDISHIYDNRARIGTRIRQLKSGFRFSQVPPSPMRRVVSNIEIISVTGEEYEVAANFMLMELAIQSTRDMNFWGGSIVYRLRRVNGELRLFYKKIMLVDADEPVANLSFLV
ncbi:MAG: benzoate transporter [Pseudomonadales bacterium]|nr:benzoate transporter [Pseudomonadales bacterium]